jgi:simple sugar transport system permease protein
VLRIAVPYALAAMGGAVTERSGVIDLALEGKLLRRAIQAAVGMGAQLEHNAGSEADAADPQ